MKALEPYLSGYWRQYIGGAAVALHGLEDAYPPGAPTSSTPRARAFAPPVVPSSYEAIKERVLDPLAPAPAIGTDGAGPDHVVLNCLTVFEAYRNPYYAAALATAVNDWLRDEMLERDPRLRASITVASDSPEEAVAEIERRSEDPRFVQVLLPVRGDAPWGHRRNHAIFATAARLALPVALHGWGRPGAAPTSSGLTTTYFEDYLGNQQVAQEQLVSLVCEGVFEHFPELRVVLIECGFAWLAPLLWRFDKDWKGLWRETPWVKERPSDYVYRHVRATTAPAHLPDDRTAIKQLLEMIDVERLLVYGSDYPHHHGDGLSLLLDELDDGGREAVLCTNAAELYGIGIKGGRDDVSDS